MVTCCTQDKAAIKDYMKSLSKQQAISKKDFMIFAQNDTNLIRLKQLQYAFYLDFNFPNPSIELQRDSIKFLLRPNGDLREYITKHLTEKSKYYLINTEFLTAWKRSVGWGKKAKVKLDDVELDVPIEKGYKVKLSNSLVYPDNFEIVPEKMYKAFRRWHKVFIGHPVARKVIHYKVDKITPYNPHDLKINNDFTFEIIRGINDAYELELSPYFFFIFKVKDNGEFPENPQPGFFNKIIGGKQTITSIEMYISR